MAERSVISVHTKPETSDRLDRLAKAMRRSKSFLANEAIERYLASEEHFIDSIRQGIAEADAGQGMTTAEALESMKRRIYARGMPDNS